MNFKLIDIIADFQCSHFLFKLLKQRSLFGVPAKNLGLLKIGIYQALPAIWELIQY